MNRNTAQYDFQPRIVPFDIALTAKTTSSEAGTPRLSGKITSNCSKLIDLALMASIRKDEGLQGVDSFPIHDIIPR